ncbi:hypothetical protein [Vibrio alginolyticus]|uniref:hypothetical protein n=1 Tax=Vibrio alginolyticus TaxID=663 RepID=UPI00375535BB
MLGLVLVKQSQAKPSQAKPSQAKPSQAKPSQASLPLIEESMQLANVETFPC